MSHAGSIGLKKRLALNLFRRYTQNITREHKLNYIMWECTLRCNLSCLHCGSDCHTSSTQKDMPAAAFLKAIDEIVPIVNPNTTTVVFTGGEPLVRSDLEDVGRELYRRGFPWGIVSNGMQLTQKRLQSLIESGLRSATISLDGLEETHNWFRNHQSSYVNAMKAIELLAATPNIAFDVVTCVTAKSLEELPTLRTKFISLGVRQWRLITVFPRGRAKDNPDLTLNPTQFKILMEFIANTRKDGTISTSYGCEGFLGQYENKVRDGFFFCRSGITVASILADGSITGCTSMRNDFVQGNIYYDSFVDVWENKFQAMRDKSWTKVGLCASCSSYKWCQGNGLHLHSRVGDEPAICHLKMLESE